MKTTVLSVSEHYNLYNTIIDIVNTHIPNASEDGRAADIACDVLNALKIEPDVSDPIDALFQVIECFAGADLEEEEEEEEEDPRSDFFKWLLMND